MERQNEIEYPESLAMKYRPERVGDFIGLDKPKAILEAFAKKPYPKAWLFVGEPGVGKTTMALALTKALPAELHHVPSRMCDLETVEDLARKCHYFPLAAKFHLCLIDEADQMTHAAQLAFLSKLDSTGFPPNTVFVFTANSVRLLESRFVSRCGVIEFQTANIDKALPDYLESVWLKERARAVFSNLPGLANYEGLGATPDFSRLANGAGGNVRDALMRLETEILAGGIPDEPKPQEVVEESPREAQEVSSVARFPRSTSRCHGKSQKVHEGPRVRFIDPKGEKFSEPGWILRGRSRNGRQVWVKELQGA